MKMKKNKNMKRILYMNMKKKYMNTYMKRKKKMMVMKRRRKKIMAQMTKQ